MDHHRLPATSHTRPGYARDPPARTLLDVSADTKGIIGTVVGATVAMTGVVVSVMAILIEGVNARADRLETVWTTACAPLRSHSARSTNPGNA